MEKYKVILVDDEVEVIDVMQTEDPIGMSWDLKWSAVRQTA